MKYSLLYTIQADHDYFRNKASPEISLHPSPETVELCRGHRLELRQYPAGISLLAPVAADGDSLLLPLPDDAAFRFFLLVEGPLFGVTTQFPGEVSLVEILSGKAYLHFTNQGLAPDETILPQQRFEPRRTDHFILAKPDPQSVIFLKGRPLEGLEADDFVITGLNGVASPSAYSEENKALTIDTSAAEKGGPFSITYRSVPGWPAGTYGAVDIYHKASPGPPVDFQIHFTARQARWRIYTITPEDQENVTISDEEGVVSFSSYTLPASALSDELDRKVRGAFTGKHIKRFELDSRTPLLMREAPYRNIKLTYVRPSLGEWAISVPNPSPLKREVEIINLST